MSFNLLTDEDIIKELGRRYENIRLNKRISDEDVSKKGGVTIDAIQRLKKGSNINITNFIKILRGLGELERLENLLKLPEEVTIKQTKKKIPKRVFKSKETKNENFIWGEDK